LRASVTGKLVCKQKRDDTGKVIRYKVQYVTKGFAQRWGIDYDKTTAPTIHLESFRSILHIAATNDWDLQQFNIKTAFLHSILPEEETMFMEQPKGFEAPGKEDWVMCLMKSIYGMKQASRIWNQTFHNAMTHWGFECLKCEWCIYCRQSSTGVTIFVVHVDNILSTSSNPDDNLWFHDKLKAQWDISNLRPPKFTLGIAIMCNRPNCLISLSQTAKIDHLVRQYNQGDAHPINTPMVAGLQLCRPDKSLPTPPEISHWVDCTPYRSLIGSLMYLAIATRLDIAYAVGCLTSFLDCYRPEHWTAAIHVLHYLKGTRSYSLTLGSQNSLAISGYSDSDYANCIDTSRSIGGYCFSLGSGMVSWSSQKQATVTNSTCYAKYMALHNATHEAIFLHQLLAGLHLLPSSPSCLLCDNDTATHLAEDHIWHSHTKHICVKYHFICKQVLAGNVTVSRVPSKDNAADIFMKPLGKVNFQHLHQYLGLSGGCADACSQ